MFKGPVMMLSVFPMWGLSSLSLSQEAQPHLREELGALNKMAPELR